jgi:hypothetical protein
MNQGVFINPIDSWNILNWTLINLITWQEGNGHLPKSHGMRLRILS